MFNKYGSLQVNKVLYTIIGYHLHIFLFYSFIIKLMIPVSLLNTQIFLRCMISCFITPIEHFWIFFYRFWDKTFNFQLVIRMQWILSPAESEKNAPLMTVHIRVNAWAQLGICFTNGKMLHNWENASWLGKCFLYY